MRAHTGKALVAGIAAAALALGACSSSGGGGGGGSSSAPSNGSTPTSASQGGGTKGTGKFASCGSSPNTCNSGTAKQGGKITYTIEKTLLGWNLNSANSNTFDFAEVLDGLVPGVFLSTPDLKTPLNSDLMVSADQTTANPQTLVYKVQPSAVWSDGSPIGFDDFYFQWKTADGTTCPASLCPPASTSGYNQIKTMTSSDNGKTITVVMSKPFSDWKSMFGSLYPADYAIKQSGGSLKTGAGLGKAFSWLDKSVPTWSGGPYKITNYTKDTSITEVPNPKWYGKVKPKLDQLVFRIITDQTQEVPALQNGEVDAIYPQPNADLVQQVDGLQSQGIQSYLGKGLTWEHLDFNTTNPVLKDVKLRTAIFTAISRSDIISRTVGQFVPGITTLGSHMYVPGQSGYKDNVTATKQGSGDTNAAKQMLTDAGYKGVGSSLKTPSGQAVNIRCTYTTGNVLRQQTCQIIQSELQQLGIKVTPTTTDDLGGTLDKGDFDLIIYAWVGTPFVIAGAQQIWELKGGADFGKNNDPAMEALINQAAYTTDLTKVPDLLNQADQKLTADAYVLPLFQKPTFLAASNKVVNMRDNATSVGPPYNVQEWGLSS